MKLHPGMNAHAIYDRCFHTAGVMDFSATAAVYVKDAARVARYRAAEHRLDVAADQIYQAHRCPGCYQWDSHESVCPDGERIAREAWLTGAALHVEPFPASEDMPSGSARVSYQGVAIGFYTVTGILHPTLTVYVGYDRDATGEPRRYMNMGTTDDLADALEMIRAHGEAPAAVAV